MAAKRFAGANTRNVCILAHVDHGKSSYADSLLAANNIITPRMAGKLRYLDSREDEQERGITMESSAVSLAYKVLRKDPTSGQDAVEDFRINLIDTPGHVDFSSEVSTASRLCDGALVLVDAVEGVCTQTITVLRQAWSERLRPILVINKLDRLIVELKLSPSEAYHHLGQLIEQVNAVMGSFFASERMEDDLRWREERDRRLQAKKDQMAEALAEEANADDAAVDEAFQERDDEDIYFDPAKGDVIFASAVDGWAFRTSRFAQLWAKKLSIREANLSRCLWGDFYLDPKTKRVLSKKRIGSRNLKPMFVQFVLDNIWAAYDAISVNPDVAKTEKIIKALELKVRPQDMRSKDPGVLLSAVFSQWLPLASTTFRAIVEKVPSPSAAQSTRIPKMLHPDLASSQSTVSPTSPLERDLYSCASGPQAATVAYVSKMFAVPVSELPHNQRRKLTADEMRQKGREARDKAEAKRELENATGAVVLSPEETEARAAAALNGADVDAPAEEAAAEASASAEEALLGFARLYSGTIRTGQVLSAVLPKYSTSLAPDHARNVKHLVSVTISHLYLIMGRELVAVDEVPAGNIFAIGGLEGKVLRNATLCSAPQEGVEAAGSKPENEWLVNLAGLNLVSAPIVRVSLEPRQPADMPKLVEGLRLLNQADPCVETLVQETGEHVILTAGELHLERCLRDLRERFAKIKIQASKPIVPFRETAVRGTDMPPPKTKDAPRGTIRGSVHDGLVSFTIRAQPLPPNLTSFLLKQSESIRRLQAQDRRGLGPVEDVLDTAAAGEGADVGAQQVLDGERFWSALAEEFAKGGREWKDAEGQAWTFGPRRTGPNVLLDKTDDARRSLKRRRVQGKGSSNLASGTATPAELPTAQTNSEPTSTELLQVPDATAASAKDGVIDVREFDDSFETAFQLSVLRGPLCAEPVSGMAFSLEKLDLDTSVASLESIRAKWSQVTGALISSLKDAFHAAILDWSPRLLLAMYSCDIQAATEVLGKVYGVVSRRRGTIVSEEMKEGTTFYTIRAMLPVVESFGFADEIRKKTSGAASPQLVFAGFEMLDLDPFWVPTTEEELEDLGEKSDRDNVARKYMDAVRKRKGMFVERKIIEHAEKQRTMKR